VFNIQELVEKEEAIIQKVLHKYCIDKGLGLEAIQEGARVEVTNFPYVRKWYWKDDLILTITHKIDGTTMAMFVIVELNIKVEIDE